MKRIRDGYVRHLPRPPKIEQQAMAILAASGVHSNSDSQYSFCSYCPKEGLMVEVHVNAKLQLFF